MHPFNLESGRSRPIDLWCTFYSDLQSETLLQEYRVLMSEAEGQQEKRFYFARDRHRYVVTRALVRTVLSGYAEIAPSDWMFSLNDYGRPLIANDAAAARKISFNVSHTDSLIIVAVGHGHEVGVDVENTRARAACIDVADRFFAPEEINALHALPEARQHQRFFEYWTLKESYIKARSMGLSIPLDHFSFDLSGDGICISIHPDQGDRPERWRFWQMSLGAGYVGALCAERVSAEAPMLRVRNVVPLVSSQELPYELLRASESLVVSGLL